MAVEKNPALAPTLGGQIARIRLENFMTYDSIEIQPGYHLNLIIGPNGTGKSSIVCAVLLGLNGKLKTLGRADQLSSYVKSGCDQSLIEIELYNPRGKNVVIRRQISSNNQSKFFVNGASATFAKINEIRKDHNIQIDNLCTFLPQEKVQDFAKMNPQELLTATEQTVGHGDMISKHEELKKLQEASVSIEKHCLQLEEQLEDKKQKNARVEDKVQSIKQKKSLHEKLALLEQKKAWLLYHEEVEKKKDVEKDHSLSKKSFEDKQKQIELLTKELRKFENSIKGQEEKFFEAARNEAGKKAVVDDRLRRAQHRIDSYEDLESTLRNILAEEEVKKQEVRRCEANVDKLTNDLRSLNSKTGSEDELKAQNEEIDRQLKSNHREDARLRQSKNDLEEDEIQLNQEVRNAESEQRLLEQRKNVRLNYLKRYEPDVYRSIQWLQENRNLFQSHIYNPMMLELNVPNPAMAKYVESRIQYRDLISFTCTNPEDLNLLIQKLRTEQKLRVNAVCSDKFDNTEYTPAVPLNRIQCYGFFAYLKDLITGPKPIIKYLCETYRIHTVPVGDASTKAQCEKVPLNIPVFYSEDHLFTVKVSVYSGNKSTSVKKIGVPKIFSQSVDENRITFLSEKSAELREKVKAKQTLIRELDSQLRILHEELEKIRKRKRSLATTAQDRHQIMCNLNRARQQVEQVQRSLRKPNEISEEISRDRNRLKEDVAKGLEHVKQAVENLNKAMEERKTAEIIFKMSRSGGNDLSERKAKCAEELTRCQETLRVVTASLRKSEIDCGKFKDAAKALTSNMQPGDRGFAKFEREFARLKNTVEELQAEIDETQTTADFLQDGNIRVLREYERRQEEIRETTDALVTSRTELEEKKSKITTLREEWLTPIGDLVEKINDNFGNFFQSMSCAGEVSLIHGDDPNDFTLYGIKIRVKFRDGIPLQDLGRYFQSGGERAVSTAIYMLSLQELTSVPFRFVDEINQGMDPVNERRIIELIIRVTSPVDSTQYFFITPKLLQNIECPNTMSVICIHNGPTAIPATDWDMKAFKRRAKGLAEEEESY